MDDFDIYSDLPDFKWLKETYEEDVDIKKEELPISEEDVKKLQEKFLKLVKVHKLVLSHYSSLWKTCKQERKRMDRQIADLRRQLDNFAFKRNHRHNVVPLPEPIQSLVACPPPLLGVNPFTNANQGNLYSYSPPSTNPILDTNNQEWNQEEQQLEENFVDNLAVPTNVITPENSHSSDESDDDIVKKSHYRSTVYGERLRKKLLEEKRNAMQQKQESALNEKNVNQENEIANIKREIDTKTIQEENSNGGGGHIDMNVKNSFQPEQLNHQKQVELQSVVKVISLGVLKEAEVTGTKKEINVRTLKVENDDRRQSKIETQVVKEPSKQEQKLRNQKENEIKENKREDQLRIKRESDIGRKNRKDDLRTSKDNDTDKKRKNDDFNFRRERDLSKKIEDDEVKTRRERNWERRKRNDKPGSRRERNLGRRRKEEEILKLERRRRQDDTEKRRKDQETERRKKEEIDKRRREEIDRRRRDEEIERRKRDEEIERRKRDEEIERRKRDEEIERRKRDEEIERRKRDEFDRRRKEEEDKKRKERELEIFKQKEIDRKRKEEEQHLMRLKEIEKKRNEKQLEELIKERKRIENEMKALTDDESEEEPVSSKDASCKEHCSVEKSLVNRENSKENTKDNSIQVNKKQSDNKKNEEWKADQRSYEIRHSSSANANNQTISNNHRKECQENVSSKSHRQQDNHTTHDKHKHNDRRSRRDQLDHELERRSSSQRNKSRHRDKSNSEGDNHSPKRIKLQVKDKGYRDRSENLGADDQSMRKIKSPKRKRQSKSKEKSPQKCKKRKISSGRDSDRNIKLDENTISKTNVSATEEIDETHRVNNENISSNCSKSSITKSSLTENVENVGLKKEKEPFAAPFGKNHDRISSQVNLESAAQVASKTQDQDPNKNNSKLTNSVADKSSNNHANKKKTLMNELFEAQEEPVNISANSKNIKRIDETLNETILSELEDGEITDSDESMDSNGLQKLTLQAEATQPKEKPTKIIQLSEKNNNNKDKCLASLREINKLTASKSTSEKKDSILYSMLVQNKNDGCQERTKTESHENASKKTEPLTLKDNKKDEACKNKIAKTAVEKSSSDSKTNNMTDVCMKENVDVNNDLIKKSIRTSTVAVNLNTEVLKPALKTETGSKDNAAGNLADTSQIKVPTRNVIVIKRRRRPVKLADSPPVVVINKINVKT